MDKDTNKKKDSSKPQKEVDIGGIMVQIDDNTEANSPSVKDLENELREGGIEVVEGRKSPEEDLPIS